jgi:homocysteine S-methyltransferase
MTTRFLEALPDRVLVCDGAMGTMLAARGVGGNTSFDALNVTQPSLVEELHREYVRAGADILETNTFGANRLKLSAFGLADSLREINVAGVRLARRAGGSDVYVAGALGPLGVRIEPWGKTGVDEARAYFREQAEALLEGGVDLFVLETFRDVNEAGAAIDALRAVSTLPIVAQMTTDEDGNTLDGTPPEQFAPELERRGAAVVGVNCAVGPAPMLETIERMEAVTRLPLSAQPNAGKPRDVEGRNIYLCSPEYMASYARRFVQHNVRVLGGCCGTTPEHIRQIRAAVRSAAAPARVFTHGPAAPRVAPSLVAPPVPRERKSALAARFAAGQFVVSVELLPPRGVETESAIARARELKQYGVDVVGIPDGVRGGARVSALALAVLVEQKAGIETLLHYACRDRKLLAIQSDLLGAHAVGIRNVLLTTGGPEWVGDYVDATTVSEVDAIGLTNVVARLNRGQDVGGQTIGVPAAFHIGVSLNPSAADLDEELRRFDFKVDAGAEFVLTRPVFDAARFEQVYRRVEAARLPVVATVHPFESARHAEFLANEVPGMGVPDALIERMRRADSTGTAAAEGVAIARELARALKGMVQGIQVSTASGNVDAALSVIDGLR